MYRKGVIVHTILFLGWTGIIVAIVLMIVLVVILISYTEDHEYTEQDLPSLKKAVKSSLYMYEECLSRGHFASAKLFKGDAVKAQHYIDRIEDRIEKRQRKQSKQKSK